MKALQLSSLTFAALLTFPAFAATTTCIHSYGGDTGVAKIQIHWSPSAANEAVVMLTGANGVQKKFKAVFQAGTERSNCEPHRWKNSAFSSREFRLQLNAGGCPSHDENGNIIKYPAALSVRTAHEVNTDAFACNGF